MAGQYSFACDAAWQQQHNAFSLSPHMLRPGEEPVAGFQDKLQVLVEGDQISFADGTLGSTHIPNPEPRIRGIGDYIARDNPRRALTFVRALRDRCLSLGPMALSFQLVRRYEDRGVRHLVHGQCQIFCRTVDDPVTRVDVLHVTHSARNYAAILFNE